MFNLISIVLSGLIVGLAARFLYPGGVEMGLGRTILLGIAWGLSSQLRGRHPLGEQAIWRAALFGSILTATLQIATGWQPLGGALSFPSGPAPCASSHASEAASSARLESQIRSSQRGVWRKIALCCSR